MRKKIHIIIVIINILVSLLTIFTCVSVYINPSVFWPISMLGLFFPYLFFANFLFLLYWLLRRKRWVILPIFLIILSGSFISDVIQLNINTEKIPEKSIKFMSYNVRVFNLYNWNKNTILLDSMLSYIKGVNPDIICFQEFYNDSSKKFNVIQRIPKEVGLHNVHDYYNNIFHHQYFGIATFSKYPIVNEGLIDFMGTKNLCIYTDIKVGDDTIRVYNNHLQSVHFKKDDYTTIDSLLSKLDEDQIHGVKGIFKKIRIANIKRAEQADEIKRNIENSPYPVVVCGDFNNTPISYTYHRMSSGLVDAFKRSGNGFGKTYISSFPFLRIDYILHSKRIKSYNFEILPVDLSDHYPITCYLEINK